MANELHTDWESIVRHASEVHSLGQFGKARDLCVNSGYLPADLPSETQIQISNLIAFGNRNLTNLFALYREHDCVRASMDQVSPALREVHEEFIQSWDMIIERATFSKYAPSSNPAHLNQFYQLLLQSGRLEDAYNYWMEHLWHAALEPERILITAEELERTGLYKEAAEQYRSLLSLDPNNEAANFGLICTLCRSGEEAEAMEVIFGLGQSLDISSSIWEKILLGSVLGFRSSNATLVPGAPVQSVANLCDEYCPIEHEDAYLIRALMVLVRNNGQAKVDELASLLPGIQSAANRSSSVVDECHLELRNRALSLIYAHILGISPQQELEWRSDPLHSSRIGVTRINGLIANGNANDAIRESSAVFQNYTVASIPPEIILVGRYKVLESEGQYYAVLRTIGDISIVNGRVIRIPTFVYQLRALIPTRVVGLPRRIIGMLWRSLTFGDQPLDRSFSRRVLSSYVIIPLRALRDLCIKLLGVMGKILRRMMGRINGAIYQMVLALVAQRAVKVSPELDELIEELRAE